MTEITKEQMIQLLNQDLTKEYAAAVQYVQHAAKLTGPEYQSIQKEMVVHANEEIGHAVSLSDQITYLGGDPTVDVAERFVSNEMTGMLKQDIAGERDAIKRYKERVAQAEALGEYGLRRALEDILVIEEEHERDLQAALGE